VIDVTRRAGMYMTPASAMARIPRAPRFRIIDVRKLFLAIAILAAVATPSFAATITYNFAANVVAPVDEVPDNTLVDVQFLHGAVLHGAITIDTSLPDLDASPDIGLYSATSMPSVLSVTIGPFTRGVVTDPPETYSTSGFSIRIAENGNGFFGNEEFLILNEGPFSANGFQIDQFEIRLDSDSLSFLSGTGFPTTVDLGLLNDHSTFEFFGHDLSFPDEAFEFFGSFTEFAVASSLPEPGSLVLVSSGLLALATIRCRRQVKRRP
jgi:hypothetical protein